MPTKINTECIKGQITVQNSKSRKKRRKDIINKPAEKVRQQLLGERKLDHSQK
jgi:hypothetical protein